MPLYVKVNLDLTEGVTLRELREFVAQADRVGASDDVDLRAYDDNPDLVGLEAIGALDGGQTAQ